MGPPNPYRMAHIPCPEGDVEQFVVHYSSPWEGGMYRPHHARPGWSVLGGWLTRCWWSLPLRPADPVSLLMLTESGHFQSNVLSRSLGYASLFTFCLAKEKLTLRAHR